MNRLLPILATFLIASCSNNKVLATYACECTTELLCLNNVMEVELYERDYMNISSSQYNYSSSYTSVWSTENISDGQFFNFYLYPWKLKAKYENELGSSELSCNVTLAGGEKYFSKE